MMGGPDPGQGQSHHCQCHKHNNQYAEISHKTVYSKCIICIYIYFMSTYGMHTYILPTNIVYQMQ